MAIEASIVIPTHNRRDLILETLAALRTTEFPDGQWEIVVVDDGSTDDTLPAIENWLASHPLPARLVSQDNSGPAAARNRGAQEARGSILIWLDDDITVANDFVASHVGALRAKPGCWILGRILQAEEMKATPFGRYRARLWEEFHNAHDPEGMRETEGISAANLSMPKDDFLRLGGFNESIKTASCEDMLLGLSARESGIRILYHPGIVVTHRDWVVDLASFCRRQELYSVSDVWLWNHLRDRSPRAGLVRENVRPLRSRRGGRAARLAVKRLLGTRPGEALLRAAAAVAERLCPDTRCCHAIYNAAVAAAIYRGVQRGIALYGLEPEP